jgi:hypothetical protein
MTEVEELTERSPRDYGAVASDAAALIVRAGRLTPAEAHALAGAVGWRWQPLSPPGRGSLAATRAEALAAARAAGRASAAAGAMEEARQAALDSVGGRSMAPRWSWAENGLAAVLTGVVGAIVAGGAGMVMVAVAFGALAVIGAGVLLIYDSGNVARRRLAVGVEAAALALVTRDITPPEIVQALNGPWSAVVRD